MKKLITMLAVVLLSSTFATSANGTNITVIDFDTLSDGDKIFDQFTDIGVKFRDEWSPYHQGSGNSPAQVTSDYSFSGPNALLVGNPGDGDDDDGDGDDDDGGHHYQSSSIWNGSGYGSGGDGDDDDGDDDDMGDDGGSTSLFILFDQPILSFSAYVLGVCGGDSDDDHGSSRTGDGDDDGGACAPEIFLNAYDANGDLIDSTGLTGNDVDWMLLTYTTMGTEIFEIELGIAGGSGGDDDDDGGDAFAVDDISFKPVPLPAALWLLGSGAFGLLALRRRIR